MATGSLFIFWPGSVQTLFQDPPFVGNEQALFRVIGMAVAVIGWLYFLEDAPAFVNSSPHLSSTELFWSQPYCCHCSSPESSLIP